MNKSVGLALLALVCLAQASAALPFSSPYSEAEKFREKGRRAIRQLDLKMDELHTAINLRKTRRAIAKLKKSTRTLQSKLDGEALFDDVVRERIEERQEMLEQRAADQEQVREDAMDDLKDWMDDLVDSQGRALLFSEEERERVQASVHKTITEINEEVLRGLGRGRTLQSEQSELTGEEEFDEIRRAKMERLQKLQEQQAALLQSMPHLADSQGRAQQTTPCNTVQCFKHEINDEVLSGLGRGRALQVHNIARGINAASKAAVVAGAVTDNKDMMKAGVAATAISGAAKIATRPTLGRPLGRAVRKGKRKLRRGVRRALRG